MKTADYLKAKKDPVARARMQSVYELYDFAVKTMRLNLRRRHPEASEDEIESKLEEWLLSKDEPLSGAPSFRPSERYKHLAS